MSRGFGVVGLLQEVIPEWLALAVALLTQLGDFWFLAVLLAVLLWVEREVRVDIAILAGVWLLGHGTSVLLKAVFRLPRPGDPLADPDSMSGLVATIYEPTAHATGYGFPSGHAISATVVFVGLAAILPWSTPTRRWTVASGLVVVVSLTRVALGVHYLVDVIAGVAIGLALLGLARGVSARWGREWPAS